MVCSEIYELQCERLMWGAIAPHIPNHISEIVTYVDPK